MNFNSLKEELIQLYKNIYSYIENSSVFHSLKEKYIHLNPLYRNIINKVFLCALFAGLLYYPVLQLYSAGSNMRSFKAKKQLTKELQELASAQPSSFKANRNILGSLKQFLITADKQVQLPKEQIQKIEAVYPPQSLKGLKLPARVESVNITVTQLNLKELIQYGRKIETLKDSLKLVGMNITENKKNYFDAVYTFSLFSLKAGAKDKGTIKKPVNKKPNKRTNKQPKKKSKESKK